MAELLQHKRSALGKFLVQFFARKRPVRAAPVSFVGFLHQAPAVHPDRLRRCFGSFRTPRLDLRVENSVDLTHHFLDRSAAHKLVGELMDSGFPPKRDTGEHERRTEFGLELGMRNRITQGVEDIRTRAKTNRPNLLRLNIVGQ